MIGLRSWATQQVADLIADSVLTIGDGYRATNSELALDGLPFARAGNINQGFKFDGADCLADENVAKAGQKVSEPGDIVFTSKGTVGRFAFVRPDTRRFVYSPQLCFWRVCNKRVIEPRFLYYWMHGREFFAQFNGVKGQTDMADYVSLRDQRRMLLTLPPLRAQRAIAGILGALDDKIELNRRMNETLEAMAQALFKSWFVDFDPVRAKMEGRQPVGMDAETAALFPDSLGDSPLGQIPRGWEVRELGEVVDINQKSIAGSYPHKTIQYVDISSVSQGRLDGASTFSLADAPSRAKRLVQHGDTIWSMVRPNRRSHLFIHTPANNLVVSTGFAVLSPRVASPSYIYAWVTRAVC
jgi:type I restriction enzyme S subunit